MVPDCGESHNWLGLVLLEDVRLNALPDGEVLLSRTAFFVANDVSDREPIIREKSLTGPGTGFVTAKGQPGFLPLGPWMVRGTELGAALFACGSQALECASQGERGPPPDRARTGPKPVERDAFRITTVCWENNSRRLPAEVAPTSETGNKTLDSSVRHRRTCADPRTGELRRSQAGQRSRGPEVDALWLGGRLIAECAPFASHFHGYSAHRLMR